MIIYGHNSHSARSRAVPACVIMLALLALAGIAHPLAAQTAPAGEQAKKADAKAAPPAASAEGFTWGVYDGRLDFEVGFRAVDFVAGNKDVYRSMVNLKEGPQLFHTNLSLRANYGAGKLFDRLDLSMSNWGFDPYRGLKLNLGKSDKYEIRAEYRYMNYYNFLPNYANPLLAKGSLFGQHSLEVDYQTTDLELKLRPTSRVRPFVAYTHATGAGPGFTTTGFTGNDFMLSTKWRYKTDEIRGGIEFVLPKLSLTVEQGYRFGKNDSGAIDDIDHTGNVSRPYLGNTITLNALNRGYHDRTSLPVSKFVMKYTPFEALKISGRYIYSMADLLSTFGEARSGNMISLEDRLIYSGAQDNFISHAKRPNHNGAFVIEFSPLSRLTVFDRFDTRSHHISGSSLMASTFFNARPLSGEPRTKYDTKTEALLARSLAFDQVRNEVGIELEMGCGFSGHAGQRFTYSETRITDSSDSDESAASATSDTGIFGFTFRPGRRMRVGLDHEITRSAGALVRTDLLNHSQTKFTWQVEPLKNLIFSGNVGLMRNKNPIPDINLRAHNRNYTFDVAYEPSARFSLNLDYTRSNMYSTIAILLPQTLQWSNSIFDERGSSTGGSMSVDVYRGLRLDMGLRSILNAGDFGFKYVQPFASVSIPLPGRFAIKTYWQTFQYHETDADYMNHRTNVFTFALAYAR